MSAPVVDVELNQLATTIASLHKNAEAAGANARDARLDVGRRLREVRKRWPDSGPLAREWSKFLKTCDIKKSTACRYIREADTADDPNSTKKIRATLARTPKPTEPETLAQVQDRVVAALDRVPSMFDRAEFIRSLIINCIHDRDIKRALHAELTEATQPIADSAAAPTAQPAPVEEQQQLGAAVRAVDAVTDGEQEHPRATVEVVAATEKAADYFGKVDDEALEDAKAAAQLATTADPETTAPNDDAPAALDHEPLPPCLGDGCPGLVKRYSGKPDHRRRVCYCDSGCWKPRGRKPKSPPPDGAVTLPGVM